LSSKGKGKRSGFGRVGEKRGGKRQLLPEKGKEGTRKKNVAVLSTEKKKTDIPPTLLKSERGGDWGVTRSLRKPEKGEERNTKSGGRPRGVQELRPA